MWKSLLINEGNVERLCRCEQNNFQDRFQLKLIPSLKLLSNLRWNVQNLSVDRFDELEFVVSVRFAGTHAMNTTDGDGLMRCDRDERPLPASTTITSASYVAHRWIKNAHNIPKTMDSYCSTDFQEFLIHPCFAHFVAAFHLCDPRISFYISILILVQSVYSCQPYISVQINLLFNFNEYHSCRFMPFIFKLTFNYILINLYDLFNKINTSNCYHSMKHFWYRNDKQL